MTGRPDDEGTPNITEIATGGGPRSESAPALRAGSRLGHYEIIRPLGRGGMGEVLLARDTRLGRLVAVKLLTRHGGERVQRFLVEARATAQVSHENIVVIHELGEHLGVPFMVLEYLEGTTLRQWMDERRERLGEEDGGPPGAAPQRAGVPAARALELMIPVVRALACAHERGVAHRDLTPSNIMLTDQGTIKVLDFGIAKLLGESERAATVSAASASAPTASAASATAPTATAPTATAPTATAPTATAAPGALSASEPPWLTAPDAVLGTQPYMSPEQWNGEPADHRADLWAVGLVLAELVLGRHPLAPLSLITLASVGSLHVPMPSVRAARPEIGKLGAIIDRLLVKRREDRLGSARELLAELSALAPAAKAAPAGEGGCPYPGLAAFREGDAARFFGRARAIGEATARLADRPLLAVVGPSGAGKSSFVRAGVIPALERAGDAWEAFVVRPGPRPLAALAELLLSRVLPAWSGDAAALADDAPPPPDREALAAALRAEPGRFGAELRARARRRLSRVLVFVDQLEELYTLAPEEDGAPFFACLAGAADDAGSPLRVVLAIRSDFLDRIPEAHASASGLGRALLLLSPLDREGLREALVRPLEAADHRFDSPRLVEEMLDALEHTKGALPLLQFTAAALWERRDRAARALTLSSYREIGGVAGTLAHHAEAVLSAMSSEERRLARAALLRLVTPDRTRAPAARRELCDLAAAPADMERVLGRLVDARLLTAESRGDADATVELVHESLIASWPTLSQWVSDNQRDAALLGRLRRAAAEWQAGGEAEDLLWRGRAAEDARRLREERGADLAPAEERFLRAVIALDERGRRARRRAAGGVIGASLIVAAAMSYLALREGRANRAAEAAAVEARSEATLAQAEQARARAQAARTRDALRIAAARDHQDDPTTVVALLREIEDREHPPQGWSALVKQALDAGVARSMLLGHSLGLPTVAWSPDGERIASGSGDKTVRVWSADGRGAPLVLSGHTEVVLSVSFRPDGRRIASASGDRTVRVWSTDGAGAPLVFSGHTDDVNGVAWSPDGRRIASASSDRTVRVWSADGAGAPLVFSGHTDRVQSVSWSPDGARLATASSDDTVRVWSADGRGAPLVLAGHTGGVNSVAFSPDGRRIASASGDKLVRVWSADGRGAPLVLAGHTEEIRAVAWSPDGRRIASASSDRTLRVWDADGRGTPLVLRGHASAVWGLSWSPGGDEIASASVDRALRVWDTRAPRAPIVLSADGQRLGAARFSPDGRRVAVASLGGTIWVWSADGGGAPVVLSGHLRGVTLAAWSPDGRRLVSASDDRTVRLWDPDGGAALAVFSGHEARVNSAQLSPDGRKIVSASRDHTVRLWNADGSGDPVVLSGHSDAVTSAAFSPDGRRVVSSSDDRTVRIWDVDGGGAPVVLSGHSGIVFWAAWSPDGRRVASASFDETVRIWDVDGGGAPIVLSGHSEPVYSVEWSPDGRRVVSASKDGTVRVWSADGGGAPVVLLGHSNAVNNAVFSPDGRKVASASYDHTARIWQSLDPVLPGDPRLWTATTYCIPVGERERLLGLGDELDRAQDEACRARVDAARRPP
jgi:WD40 repeat protein/serine/threonine protein kinase